MPDLCPSPEIMSEYLLGRVEPALGARIDTHLDNYQVFEHEPELQTSLKSTKYKKVCEPGGSLEQTQLGPYRLMKLLGKGGMGEVYSAQKRIVAMPKLENPELTQTQITHAGIAFLQPSTSLRRLHVAAPGIDDRALEALSKLTQLTYLSVGDRMLAESVETLRTRLPHCQINAIPRGE